MTEDTRYGVVVSDLRQQKVNTFDEVVMLLNYGEEHRNYKET